MMYSFNSAWKLARLIGCSLLLEERMHEALRFVLFPFANVRGEVGGGEGGFAAVAGARVEDDFEGVLVLFVGGFVTLVSLLAEDSRSGWQKALVANEKDGSAHRFMTRHWTRRHAGVQEGRLFFWHHWV
jgi:hypothetical protein